MATESAKVLKFSLKAFEGLIHQIEAVKLFNEDFIDNGPFFFAILDMDYNFLKLNSTAELMLKCSHSDLIGKNLRQSAEIFPNLGEMHTYLDTTFSASDRHQDSFEVSSEINGAAVSYSLRAKKIAQNLRNNAEYILLIGTDITAYKNYLTEKIRGNELEFSNKIFERTLEMSADIQKMLIKDDNALDDKKDVKIKVLHRASEYCSGDFWWADWIEDRFILIICDVMGHGVASGMLGSFMNGYIQAHFSTHSKIDESFVKRLGRQIETLTQQKYTTTFCALEVSNNEVKLWNAGGLSPLCIAQDGSLNKINLMSSILGLGELSIESIILPRSDIKRIIWHSDGFGDFRLEDERLISRKRVNEIIQTASILPLSEVIDYTSAQINEISLKYRLVDDITFVVVDL